MNRDVFDAEINKSGVAYFFFFLQAIRENQSDLHEQPRCHCTSNCRIVVKSKVRSENVEGRCELLLLLRDQRVQDHTGVVPLRAPQIAFSL